MTSNTKRQANQAQHAFEGSYDAKQHQPNGSEKLRKCLLATLTHKAYTHITIYEYFPGCYRLIVTVDNYEQSTHCTRVDRADVEDYYYNAYNYTDEDDEVLLYQIMTAIAAIKLFDGMRKFVGWEEV